MQHGFPISLVNPIDWSRKANTNMLRALERGLPTPRGTISAKEMRIAMAVAAAGIIAEPRRLTHSPPTNLLSTTWSAMSGSGCRTATTPTTMARLRTDRPGLVTTAVTMSSAAVRGARPHKRFVRQIATAPLLTTATTVSAFESAEHLPLKCSFLCLCGSRFSRSMTPSCDRPSARCSENRHPEYCDPRHVADL